MLRVIAFCSMEFMWTDTHAHLDKLEIGIDEALTLAREKLVNRIITIGTELEDWPHVLSLCDNKSSMVYGALGMHPHTAKDFDQACMDFLKNNLIHPRIVSVGEIGLDYHYNNSEQGVQQTVFEKQLQLAKEFNLPVEIHTRDAELDTISALQKVKGQVRGLLHCFTGSYNLAKAALDCGFNISFSGILTFKKSEELRETCKKIPLDRLHIETDSPFLSPVPYRGKENHPAQVSLVAEIVAFLHNTTLKDLSEQLEQNTLGLFTKIKGED